MSIENFKDTLPDYAKDIRLNLSNISRGETLSPKTLWGSMLAVALVSHHRNLVEAIEQDENNPLESGDSQAARSAAAIMSMNNVYYRFGHTIDDPEIEKMPARLRMNVIGNPGCDRTDFECWCLAVSIVNNCQKCIKTHAAQLTESGITKEQISEIGRVAAVVKAAADVSKWETSTS